MKADIAERLARLREDLEAELRACGREPGSVTIVGVTKKQPVEAMIAAVQNAANVASFCPEETAAGGQ